nr:TNF receptor-associated factor 5-like [Pocillopora verrucosa]
MSSSHLTNGKIVEFAPNGPQTESSEPNEQFIAMLVYEPRNSEHSKDVFPDKATERKILSFAIKCPSEGCEWTGELREKEVHLSSCPCKVIPCCNENCFVRVQRRHLSHHLGVTCEWRIIKCDYCSESQPRCQMQDHIHQCSKFPVTCPNKCSCLVPRGKVRSISIILTLSLLLIFF